MLRSYSQWEPPPPKKKKHARHWPLIVFHQPLRSPHAEKVTENNGNHSPRLVGGSSHAEEIWYNQIRSSSPALYPPTPSQRGSAPRSLDVLGVWARCLGLFASAVSTWCLHRLGMCSVVSRWCLGLFASAVSRWCLHRLGMCSVAPKLVLCGFQRWRETVFWFKVWAVFGACPDGLGVFLHLQCPDCVCIGWACSLWLQSLCSVAVLDWIPKVTWNSFLVCGLGRFRRVSRWCLGLFASAVSRWCLHSKGDVKQFFGLRFGRFSARVQMVFRSFCICSF